MTDSLDPRRGLSRRSFLKGTAVASAAGAGLTAASHVVAPPRPQTFGPGEHEIQLRINGKDRKVKVETRTTLLDALRDSLDLTGAKKICDRGACGGCTVHVDGVAVRSCTMTVEAVVGRTVTTIEGLSERGLHPLQQAWLELGVPQCGYCQTGQIMTAAALLAHTPRPTEQETREAMNGNLCRCGTYARILAAVRQATE